MNAIKNYIAIIVALFLLLGCTRFVKNKGSKEAIITSNLLLKLPDYCPTPDAFALAPDGSITLSCPNYADNSKPGVLVKIDNNMTVEKLCEIPMGNGKLARPIGIDYATDGSLYVCASPQILRLSFNDDSLKSIEVVADGINGPNGLKIYRNFLFVTVPVLPNFKTEKNTSGLYRFHLDDRNIQVNGDTTDVNLVFSVQTQNPRRQFGLDGLVFDSSGNLFAGDFGDGTIYRLSFAPDGKLLQHEIYTTLPDSSGIDGMTMDEHGNLFVAGFSQNEIWKIDTNKNARLLVRYPDNNGENGELDQPVDLVIKGRKLIISNFDLMTDPDMVNRKHSKPYTLSFINLDEIPD